MVQAKPFGNLRFDSRQHDWALQLGLFLGNWLGCREDQVSPQVQSKLQEHASMCKSEITHRLQLHGINIEIPDYDSVMEKSLISTDHDSVPKPSPVFIDHAILVAVRTNCSPDHCAFVLIGKAASVFEWADRLSVPRDIQELQRRSKVAIGQLQQYCEDLFPDGVQAEAIYEQLQRTKGNWRRVRQLLLDLQKPMVILLVLADAVEGKGRLSLLKELRRVTETLLQSANRDSFHIEILPDVTVENFGPTLVDKKPTIVHFSGHGSPEGLFFSNQEGEATKVEPRHLSRLLSLSGQHNLQGVVLNACFTSESFRDQDDLDQQMILMEGPLEDSTAIRFAQQFYAYLGAGLSFKGAFTHAEASTNLAGNTPIRAAFIEKSL